MKIKLLRYLAKIHMLITPRDAIYFVREYSLL